MLSSFLMIAATILFFRLIFHYLEIEDELLEWSLDFLVGGGLLLAYVSCANAEIFVLNMGVVPGSAEGRYAVAGAAAVLVIGALMLFTWFVRKNKERT